MRATVQHGPSIRGVNSQTGWAVPVGLSFPVLPDSDGRVSSNRYFIRTLPTSFIIDPSGNVRYQWSGQLPRETMLARLAQVW